MQIGKRDAVVVDDPERPDAGSGQILQRGRAQAAGADDQSPRRLEPVLTGAADAAQHDLARIALDFRSGKAHGALDARGRLAGLARARFALGSAGAQ